MSDFAVSRPVDGCPIPLYENGELIAMVISVADYRHYEKLEDDAEDAYFSSEVIKAKAEDDGSSTSLDEMRSLLMQGN